MPWLTFLAWSERVERRRVERRNARARAEWRARIEEMKRKGV